VRRSRLLASLVAAAIALVAASAAMLPGVQFWDTGELQAVAPLMGTAHPTGFPTYVLLGWLASVVLQPFGEPAFRMNLFSALCLAAAAGVTVDLVRALTGRVVIGLATGIALALTPIAWAVATHAETHSLHLALVAILLWLLVTWDAHARPSGTSVGAESTDRGGRFLVAASFVFALAVGNHSLTLLLAIPVGLYVLAVDPAVWRRGRLVWSCIAVLALTLVAVYLELPLRSAPGPFRAALVYGTPYTWDGFGYIVLAEQFQGSLQDPFGDLPRKFGDLIGLAVAQFGIFAPLIPVGFIATAIRSPRYALLTGSAAAITCFFAASYVNADINRYYLGPALMAWTWLAILAGTALDALTRAAADPGMDDQPAAPIVATRSAATALLLAVALLVPTAFALPDRYRAVDIRGDHAATIWVDHVLDVMAPNAVIVSWWSYSTPLWYAQRVEGRRPDITIVDDRTRLDEHLGGLTDVIDANLPTRPVYVIRLDRSEVALLAQRYQLDYIDGSDASMLTRVVGPRTAGI
jgi:transmembrane protein TMEM260 (protein O-mannosyltransferase)